MNQSNNLPNRVVAAKDSLYIIVDAVKNIDKLAKQLFNKSDEFNTLKVQDYELPVEEK